MKSVESAFRHTVNKNEPVTSEEEPTQNYSLLTMNTKSKPRPKPKICEAAKERIPLGLLVCAAKLTRAWLYTVKIKNKVATEEYVINYSKYKSR